MTTGEIAIFGLAYVIVGTFALGGISAAPWVRTRRKLRDFIASRAELKPGDVVYDLGCGDGAVLFSLARKEPGIKAVGYEIAILPWALGLLMKAFGGKKYANVSLRCRDFFGANLSDADTVFIFLLEESYPKVVAKLAKELRDDARVVVAAWPLPAVEPERKERGAEDLLPVYFYRGRQLKAAKPA